MSIYINGSNREKNCYTILKDIMGKDDKLISLDSVKGNYGEKYVNIIKELEEKVRGEY